MNYTPQEVADLLKDKPHQPHYIAAMVQKAVQQALAQQDKEIEALRGFAQAVLIDGAYGFDPERLPKIAVNFGLITTRRGTYGPSGNESPMTYSDKTSLLTGQ